MVIHKHIEGSCQVCADVERYVSWVKKLGVVEAQRMQAQVEKNKKKFEKLLKHD